jgi:PAS domain S-box-containing protein
VLNEEIQARIRVEAAAHQLAAIVESSDDAIRATTLNGQILTWNPGAERLYGYTRAEVVGKHISLLHVRPHKHTDLFGRIGKGERISRLETVNLAKDGRRIDVSLTVSPILDHSGQIVSASTIAHDITDRKLLDRMKDDFVGTVSHELRTPLAAIKGYATTLLEHDRMKAGLRREFLTVIDSESERLEDLINNLLDMSRLEAGVLKVDPAPVKLGRVVQTVVKRAQRLTREHHLVVEWRKDPWVMADVPRVLQVLTNLLNNAVKYSPDGGEIRVVGWEENGMLKIAVHDAGVGIPPRELDKIFDRFHRIEGDMARRVSGTGLGLAICRGLVEAHGGRIWVESEPDAGSTFTFSIPVCDPVVS